ncbi:hypothetical protein BKA62DRAFT_764984 [Auriculariales sp. MPI-PUGE-AT-0066]|nr:hypothetical protein BKA62DRAFT_764984 [Auriculariales sp. MPI-PUGE-AT-0066]
MTKRLYLGRLPTDVRSEDVQKFFDGYGRIIDCRVMTGFGFIEFENSKDAEEVVQVFNGKAFQGAPILVEFAKDNRSRREPYEDRGPPQRSRRPPGVRLIVSGISRDTSWQDLKDFGREAGNISFADIDRDNPGQGILEYMTKDDADHAIKTLDSKDLRGQSVHVALAPGGGEDRGYDRGGRDDRHRDDRHERGYRARSRSPPRRDSYYDRDRRGGRSPPVVSALHRGITIAVEDTRTVAAMTVSATHTRAKESAP